MVEISGFIHQLNVGKTQKEKDNRNSIFIAQSDTKRSDSAYNENEVRVISNWLHPLKSVITEKEFRFNIEFMNPSVKGKTHYTN